MHISHFKVKTIFIVHATDKIVRQGHLPSKNNLMLLSKFLENLLHLVKLLSSKL